MRSFCVACLALVAAPVAWGQDKPSDRHDEKQYFAGKSLGTWVQSLKDKDPNIRQRSAEALGNIGADAPLAVEGLVAALKDNSGAVRAEAAWAVGQCLPLGQPAIKALILALRDEEPRVRLWAARALGKIKPVVTYPNDGAYPGGSLANALEVVFCSVAVWWYEIEQFDSPGRADPESIVVIRALIDRLSDPDARVRRNSARSLGDIGSVACFAVPTLARALKDENDEVRQAASDALKVMGRSGEAAVAESQEFTIFARLQPAEDDPVGNNRPLRSAALRMPFVYVMDREGDLYVFKVPKDATDKEVLPTKVIRSAGDGDDLKVYKDCLLCNRCGCLEVYSLKDAGAPQHLGRFGPAAASYDSQTIVCAERSAFLIGRDGILVYDLANSTAPRYLGMTSSRHSPWTGCVVGNYLYVGEIAVKPTDKEGISVYDISNPSALREVGFVATDRAPFALYGVRGNRLVVSLDGNRFDAGRGVNGNAQLFALLNPKHPTLLGRYANAGGRATTVLTSDKRQYFVCKGGIFPIDKHGLNHVEPHPTGGSLADGMPYHGDSDDRYAVLALGGQAVVMRKTQ